MSFEYDIFISYAHIDDRSPSGDEKGWVDHLYERLSIMLAQALGEELKIWRDDHSLRGNDELGGAIGEGVARSLLLVPVISPRYVQSDWCNREMEAFHASAPPPQAAGPAFRKRVFKVVKTPLPEHLKPREPQSIRDLLGYEFYGRDDSDGSLREFSPGDKMYLRTLTRLVSQIKDTLIELKYSPAAQQPVSAAPPAPPQKFVYLAQTTADLTPESQAVRDELRQRGYGVLPEQKLPLEEGKKTEEAVRADLARCALSVHLVGARYGSTPEDDARSVVRIQEELAAERELADPSFQRLLWVSAGLLAPGAEIGDERQKAFIAGLQNRVTARAELLQMTVEDLKTRIVEKLSPAAAARAPHARDARRTKLKRIYLICEKRDRPSVRPIRDYLMKHNFEVIIRAEDEMGEKLADYHRKNLKECDAALIYFGTADEPWVRKNLDDLEKAYGYGREDDWSSSAVYVGSPSNDEKEFFDTNMVELVIHNFSGFNPDDLRDFVSAVEKAEDGGQR